MKDGQETDKHHSTYRTVAEMRADSETFRRLDTDPKDGKEKSRRFEGSTRPELVYELVGKNERVLELGPIAGPLTRALQERGYAHLSTLDVVDVLDLPDRAKLEAAAVCDVNTERFPFADGVFDAVVSFGLFEHLENPFHAAREVARVLKKDGLFIMAVPNVLHIVSRLVFLRRGMFPRWSYGNNHISILPHGVFEKTILRDFKLLETRYYKPFFYPLGRLARCLPENEWFADYVCYVLSRR